jgi:predicted DNA binding CopG/RHH family protein
MSLEDAIKATYQEGILATMVITLEGAKSKMERVNISVSSRDLAKIDRYAKSHGLTRSAFLIQAAQKMIQRGA